MLQRLLIALSPRSYRLHAAMDRSIRASTPDQAFQFAEQALLLAQSWKSWPLGLRDRASVMADIHELRGASLLDLARHDPERYTEQAVQELEAALKFRNGSADPRAQLAINLAFAYLQRLNGSPDENVATGMAHFDKGVAILTSQRARYQWALAHMNLAATYTQRRQGDPNKNIEIALRAGSEALHGFNEHDTPMEWANLQMMRAQLFSSRKQGGAKENYRAAKLACYSALRVYDPVKTPRDWAIAQQALGNVIMGMRGAERARHVPDAIKAFEAALSVQSLQSDRGLWSGMMANLANAYALEASDRGANLERSVKLQSEALAGLDPVREPRDWGFACHLLATYYADREVGRVADNIEQAIALEEQALVVLRYDRYRSERGDALEWLGSFFEQRVRGERPKNLAQAAQAYRAARDLRSPEEVEANRRLHFRLYRVLRALGDEGRSAPKDDATATNEKPRHCDPTEFLQEQRRYAAAVTADDEPQAWVEGQLNLAAALQNTIPPSTGDSVESAVRSMKPQLLEAVAILDRVAHFANSRGERASWGRIRDRAASVWLQLHLFSELEDLGVDGLHHRAELTATQRSAETEHYLDRAIAASNDMLTVCSLKTQPHLRLRTAVSLGRAHIWKRDWAGADAAYSVAAEAADHLLSDIEANDIETRHTLHEMGDLANAGAFCALMRDDVPRALALLDGGRSRQLAKAFALEALPVTPEVQSELHELRVLFAKREQQLVSPWLINRMRPLREAMRLRERLRELLQGQDVPAQFRRLNVSQVLDEVTRDGAVLVVPIFSDVGGRIIVGYRRDGELAFEVLSMSEEQTLSGLFSGRIDETSSGWQTCYQKFQAPLASMAEVLEFEQMLRALARALGEAFGAPLMRGLARLGLPADTSLNILPQGVLGLFPLSIVEDQISQSVLVAQHDITLNTGLTTLAHARRRVAAVRAQPASLAIVAPEPLRRLPCTDFEVEMAGSFLPKTSHALRGAEATLEATLELLRGREIWHFASHGDFQMALPARSGIDLSSQQRLTVETLLHTHGLGTPRLVVLSACESGVYDVGALPNEFMGLPAAFLQAGACGVLATLWPIADCAAALLVARFYECYLGEKQSPARALRSAQLWLRAATFGTLASALYRWREEGRLGEAVLTRTRQELETVARFSDGRNQPFESQLYWGAFVYYGA